MKVAIIGYTDSRKLAPYGNEEFEIWGLNNLHELDGVKKWHRWFQLHTKEEWNENPKRVPWDEVLKMYAKWGCPVYMQDVHPEVPNSVKYPLEETIESFGRYFTNSISYMIALAITEGFKEIHLYGVDMATSSEYGHQRPSCEFLLGWARGMGIKIYIPPESDLLKSRYLYGYEQKKINAYHAKIKSTVDSMKERQRSAQEQLKQIERVEAQYDGAISACEDIAKWHF